MKKLDARKAELMSIITKVEDPEQIKSIAKLILKMDELVAEEGRLVALQEKITRLTEEIADELKGYQAAIADKPKSNRGRKKKSVTQ